MTVASPDSAGSGRKRVPRPFVVLGFSSTHDALAAESALEAAGIDPVPVPAPASISAECGIALRLEPWQRHDALETLSREGIAVSRIADVMDV